MSAALLKGVLDFTVNDSNKLLAVFTCHKYKPRLDQAILTDALFQLGYADLYIADENVAHLIERYNAAADDFVAEIGERRDGQCLVLLDDEKMTARLTLSPPRGGKAITADDIHQALQNQGVTNGVLSAVIDEAVQQGFAMGTIIAQGQLTVHGADAAFEVLISDKRENNTQANSTADVDYRELGTFVFVNKGDIVMRRTPPIAGTRGVDLMGKTHYPTAGVDTPFADNLKGVHIDPDNPSLLVATISGLPKIVPHGVMVSPVLEVKSVNMTTGNLRFEGSIIVRGDVTVGMKVHAADDIYIGGSTEDADIKAGGNVVIKGGVIGSKEVHNNKASEYKSRIVCRGSVEAMYVKNTYIEAANEIALIGYVRHSYLISLNRIIIGKYSSKSGQVIGGLTSATNEVKAGIIGTDAGIKTRIMIGFNPELQAKLKTINWMIENKEKELDDLMKIMNFIMANPERDTNDLLKRTLATKNKLDFDRVSLFTDRNKLQDQMVLSPDAKVIVDLKVYSGAHIQIGNSALHEKAPRDRGSYRLIKDAVVFEK